MATDSPARMGWPKDHPDDIANLYAVERERLLELLSPLRVADWESPSPCPGWSVLGLSCHLVGEDLGLLARQRDGYHGTEAPTIDESGFIEWLDSLQNEWVTAARRLSPRVVLDILAWSGPQVVSMFASQDLSSISASVFWASSEPVPIWLEQLRDLSEFWIHRQQILQALGRDSDLQADLAGPVMDCLRWAYPYRLSGIHPDEDQTVIINVTGAVARTWYLVFTQTRWQYAPDSRGRIAATLEMTTEQYWRLLTNNLPPQERAQLVSSGEEMIVHVLQQTRAIVGEPH